MRNDSKQRLLDIITTKDIMPCLPTLREDIAEALEDVRRMDLVEENFPNARHIIDTQSPADLRPAEVHQPTQ